MKKTTSLILFSLLLSGCRVHDHIDCNSPPVAVSNTYLNDQEGVAYNQQWWREFQSLGLNEVMYIALDQNYDLHKAWNRLYQAQAQAIIAGSERFPQVSIANQYQHTDTKIFGAGLPSGVGVGGPTTFTSGASGSTNRYFLTPSLAYEIDLWQRICSKYQAAEWEAFATYENVQSTALVLSGLVTEVWLTIQEQLSLIQLLKHQIEVSKTLTSLVETRFAVGESSALDVYQQRLQLESTEAQLPPIHAQLEIATNQLQVLMAEPPSGLMKNNSPEMLDTLPPFPRLRSPMDLINTRPDLRAEYNRLVSADYEVASAIADRFPKLSLILNYQFTASTVKNFFEREFFSLVTDLLTPVIDGGRRRAEVERRKAIVCERLNSFSQAFLVALE